MTGPHLTFNNHYYIEYSIISVLYFSRQRYVLGDSAMQRMAKSSVLLCGMGGLGVEIGTYTTIVLGIVEKISFRLIIQILDWLSSMLICPLASVRYKTDYP